MWIENNILKEDVDYLSGVEFIPWDKLKNSTVFITGATGLIGRNLIAGLAYTDLRRNLNMHIIALVRNMTNAKHQFKSLMDDYDGLELVEGCVEELPDMSCSIDYIIHGASPTASSFFVENPVELIKTSVLGTVNLLDLAKNKNVKSFVYLSSMEVYGESRTEDKLFEDSLGPINTLAIRNCYPEAKRLCENMVVSYNSEYAVPGKIIRLAQTFGPGVDLEKDQRVFAEFARCVINNENIRLVTLGDTKRPYLYTMDAASAIMVILMNGEDGSAYNAANEVSYCSIKEMAEMVSDKLMSCNRPVIFVQNKCIDKYLPKLSYNLDTSKIKNLGWYPHYSLIEQYMRMIG